VSEERNDARVGARVGVAAVIALTLWLSGCGGGHHSTSTVRRPIVAPRAELVGSHSCPGQPGFSCSILRVPLDYAGQTRGTLDLAVGASTVSSPPRGVLLFLAGGPGQPGVPLLTRVYARLHTVLAGYRIVMFDQRGTGAAALDCPALQAAAGTSDLAVAPSATVMACARSIGVARRYYSTPETVADIEQLRVALGVKRLTLDGVSYGTFVAERYALTYPTHVARLVLDSVVPHIGVDPLYRAAREYGYALCLGNVHGALAGSSSRHGSVCLEAIYDICLCC
jgi:pimeloyl-ACP methyl ester carboxylesterase